MSSSDRPYKYRRVLASTILYILRKVREYHDAMYRLHAKASESVRTVIWILYDESIGSLVAIHDDLKHLAECFGGMENALELFSFPENFENLFRMFSAPVSLKDFSSSSGELTPIFTPPASVLWITSGEAIFKTTG